jgi:hypothetical protein
MRSQEQAKARLERLDEADRTRALRRVAAILGQGDVPMRRRAVPTKAAEVRKIPVGWGTPVRFRAGDITPAGDRVVAVRADGSNVLGRGRVRRVATWKGAQ